MPGYDASHYDPPAPIAIVTLRAFDATRSISDVHPLIDTGADVTLVPRAAIDRVGVPHLPEKHYELIGFDGTRSTSGAVDLDMIFLRRVFRGRYLLTDETHGVLGRDVLAALKLTFDGPQQTWSE